jgi:hypothetical protein
MGPRRRLKPEGDRDKWKTGLKLLFIKIGRENINNEVKGK